MKSFSRTPLLALAALCLLNSPTNAETIVIPEGSKLSIEGATVPVTETLFLVNRAVVDGANADAALAGRIAESLMQCEREKRLALEKKDPPAWIAATKWAGVGLVVAGAFAAGFTLGR